MIKRESFAWQKIDGNTLYLLNETNGKEFFLEGIAVEIWDCLWSGLSIDSVVKKYTEKYDVTCIEEDLKEFIKSMKEQGILE